jgi:hypothetical protein
VLTGSAAPSPSAAMAVPTVPPCKPQPQQDTAPCSSRLTDGIRLADRKGIGRGSLTGAGLFGLHVHVHGLPAGLTCSCDNPLFALNAADAWE